MRSLQFEFPSALWEPQYIVVLLLHILFKGLMLALRSFISRQSVQLLTVSNWLLWLPLFSEHETVSELGRAERGQAEVCTTQWSLGWFVYTSAALPFKISENLNTQSTGEKKRGREMTRGRIKQEDETTSHRQHPLHSCNTGFPLKHPRGKHYGRDRSA